MKPVELTEREASLVLGNWCISPMVSGYEVLGRRRLAFYAAFNSLSPPLWDQVDRVASVIRVVKRRGRR